MGQYSAAAAAVVAAVVADVVAAALRVNSGRMGLWERGHSSGRMQGKAWAVVQVVVQLLVSVQDWH